MSKHILFKIKNVTNFASISKNQGQNISTTSFKLSEDKDECADRKIKKLFLDKISEYKSKSDGGKIMVEPTPETERELKNEMEKIKKKYEVKSGEDLSKFPSFKWKDDIVDPIDIAAAHAKEKAENEVKEALKKAKKAAGASKKK